MFLKSLGYNNVERIYSLFSFKISNLTLMRVYNGIYKIFNILKHVFSLFELGPYYFLIINCVEIIVLAFSIESDLRLWRPVLWGLKAHMKQVSTVNGKRANKVERCGMIVGQKQQR